MVRARAADLDTVMAILDEAAAWLVARRIRQWSSPHPPHVWACTAAAIARDEVYLAMITDEQAIGTLQITWTDSYWPHDPEQAGYVHGLAIRAHVYGYHLGAYLVDWAKDQVRQGGRHYLRLDCAAQNAALCHYYECLGFRFCGAIEDQDYQAHLYEIAV
jgi:RimJ/RimL family protein N-acetyltransferase